MDVEQMSSQRINEQPLSDLEELHALNQIVENEIFSDESLKLIILLMKNIEEPETIGVTKFLVEKMYLEKMFLIADTLFKIIDFKSFNMSYFENDNGFEILVNSATDLESPVRQSAVNIMSKILLKTQNRRFVFESSFFQRFNIMAHCTNITLLTQALLEGDIRGESAEVVLPGFILQLLEDSETLKIGISSLLKLYQSGIILSQSYITQILETFWSNVDEETMADIISLLCYSSECPHSLLPSILGMIEIESMKHPIISLIEHFMEAWTEEEAAHIINTAYSSMDNLCSTDRSKLSRLSTSLAFKYSIFTDESFQMAIIAVEEGDSIVEALAVIVESLIRGGSTSDDLQNMIDMISDNLMSTLEEKMEEVDDDEAHEAFESLKKLFFQ